MNVTIEKKFDKNHIVKNIGKTLYDLQKEKSLKLSKSVIVHLQKCLKYALAKNAGNEVSLRENLKAIVPHQFGDHSLCFPRFCSFKRNPSQKYQHRSLPYKSALKNDPLRVKLETVFAGVAGRSKVLADLGSSQQGEHANKEVTLRAPKNVFYGGSQALDFRVHATAAFVNDGRHYISKVCYISFPLHNALSIHFRLLKRRHCHLDATLLPTL
jgi:hypothetical protein